MGYKVLYGNQLLFDPYTDDRITDTKLSSKLNAASYFDFTIAPTHSLYSKLAERAGEVRIYFNNLILFKGEISQIEEDFEGNYSVSCTGVLDYLTATRVRPYSTVEEEQPLKAPSSYDGYFQWLIDQHNSNCLDSRKHFSVGVNQGNMLDKNNYIYRSSEQRPTTASEIEDKILNSAGGYLFVRYQDDLNILDLYADVHDVNTQIIDYGINMLDFTKTTTTESQYTAVVATGYTPDPPEGQTDVKMKPITLEGCVDGGTPYSSTIVKMGDRVYDVEAVKRYGYHEYYVSNTDITTYDGLLYYACKTLNTLLSPALTISVKAVDLALIVGDKYKHLQLGQAVRIRSKPRKVDEYFMVNSIDLDLMNPENTTFDLGASYDTLTGQQSAYLKTLNASINASLDSVAALDKVTKENAKGVDEAKKDAANATSKANEANNKADTATETANSASSKADEANAKADTAANTANNANTKAEEAKADAANASSKADTATETANSASSKADTAINNSKDAADKASDASQKADANTSKITIVENTIKTISGDTAIAIANANAAKDAADAAKQAADQAQSDASTANTEIGKVQSQVGTINTEISNIKQEATDLRDDLSGQITTVKNTMEADYTRKTELSETTNTLRNEISESAAGVIHTVSQDYATKKELKTTTDATNKNAEDLTNAIKKFNSDVDNLQGQIDGAIETWFYEVDPTDENEPAVNWNTNDLKKVHLGDLYYNTVSGYCWRYQLQNGSYSWSRITDVDVTKALADAAAAQTTANSKKRIFVTTPNPPYDIGDLWTQGSAGDIMRCQTAKTSSQSYAAADWIKASKYTDDTAVTNLSNTVEKTYSTKTEVKQLSDQVSSTVSSLETVRVSAEAAQTSADNAKKAADAAQTAADTAKANAATAQSKADEAAKNLATAEQNLKTLQSQANATDEQVAAAKIAVENAKKAADAAQSDATTAKNAADKAQSTANTAKANAATAQSTADTAKANAKAAQDDVNALKNRVTTAETSIKQNSDAIALRATKTEVTSAIDKIDVGGRNLFLKTGFPAGVEFVYSDNTDFTKPLAYYTNNSITFEDFDNLSRQLTFKLLGDYNDGIVFRRLASEIDLDPDTTYIMSCWVKVSVAGMRISRNLTYRSTSGEWQWRGGTNTVTIAEADTWTKISIEFKPAPDTYAISYGFTCSYGNNATMTIRHPKLEKGNKSTDWSPAPEDLVAESKTYTDAQLKITSDSITSTVSQTYLKNEDASKNYASSARVENIESKVTQTADSITATFNSLKKQIDDKTEVVNAWITEGSDGTNPYLELGTNKSDLKTRLTNSELAFMDGTDKVAYISNNTMSITNADIDIATINQLSIFPYQLTVKNGHLLIQYIGG